MAKDFVLVTVLINNYNYARYLGAAIESALAQTYRPVEVVVVDDGSVDDSRSVISGYGDAILPVYKENGGQASAFNVGFAESRGEIVRFLDADDVLTHSSVEEVAEAFCQHPDAGMVQCRVEVADAAGTPLGVFIPPAYVRMPTGDLRLRTNDLNNASWWASTSGISVASTVLKRVLPLPEDLYPISADHGLALASALCAPVVSLEMTGAYYRSHGRNSYNRTNIEANRIRDDVRRLVDCQRYLRQFAERVGVEDYPEDPYTAPDSLFLIQRLLAVKLGAANDRLPGDTLRGVTWKGLSAAFRRPDVGGMIKLLHVGWFALVAVLPRPLARRLANRTLFQQNRARVSKLVGKASETARTRRKAKRSAT